MIEYILLVSLNGLPSDNVYAGSFNSCQEAFSYAAENYADWKTHTCVKEAWTKIMEMSKEDIAIKLEKYNALHRQKQKR